MNVELIEIKSIAGKRLSKNEFLSKIKPNLIILNIQSKNIAAFK